MMTLLILWIITNFIAVVYWIFRFKVLYWLGKEPFEDFKPFTCYFCMANWIGLIMALIHFDIDGIYFLMLNFITAYALGKLFDI
jgi:hypothetical protein